MRLWYAAYSLNKNFYRDYTFQYRVLYTIDYIISQKKTTMKLMKVRNGFNLIYYHQTRRRYVNKFYLNIDALLDFAVAQPELYIEFFDVDIRDYATEHKHPILTRKSLIFA